MSSGWKFEVIHKTLQEGDNLLSVSMLCDIAGVSRSGYYRWINAADVREQREIKDREDFELKSTHGVRQSALKGLEIMQVETLPGKELTTPPEVSFELLMVTLVAKRKQRDSRDSYRAPKYRYTRRAMLLSEQKPTCGFIFMVRFHTLLRCRRPVHAIQGFQVNRGEPVSSTSQCKMWYAKQPKGRMANVLQVVGQLHITDECG